MFKSIFGRLMWSNLLILLISFFLTGLLVFSLMGTYAIDQKANALKSVAPEISEITIFQLENSSIITTRYLEINLDVISNISQSDIFITDPNGSLYVKSSRLKNMSSVDPQYLEKTLQGETTQIVGTLGGVFTTPVLTVGYPLIYNGEVIGGIFMNAATPNMNENRYLTLRLFLLSGGVVALIAFLIMYLISTRMTKPLKSINKAARNIASGNFKERVKVTTKDEIGQLGATFNYMADSLQQLDDVQNSFIANVSHELRTPMTTIAGFIENILNGTIPPADQDKYLQIALSETKRLARLVNDMLDISKMSVGQYSLDIKPFDIAELIRLTVIQFENPIDEKHLDVSVDFQSDHMMVLADRDSISRVVTNLMDNAVKFSDPAAHLEIKAFIKDKKVFVAVTNEGMGIDPQDIGHIFDRFYKTDKSRNDKKGTGLGLYLVKNLLSIHNQTIAVQSVDIPDEEYEGNPNHPARRTTFLFSLEKA